MTKTIQNSNFVQFMHEVVDAIEAGYTLDYEPVNAPESTPSYKVTLVEKSLVEQPVDTLKNMTVEVKVLDMPEVQKTIQDISNAVQSLSDSQKAVTDSNTVLVATSEDTVTVNDVVIPSKPQAGRPPRGARK